MSDPLAPARGVLVSVFLGAIFWAVLLLILFGSSPMSELGRRAVTEGVIR